MEEYDAFFRNLDPQTGRWWQIDPKIESGYEDLSPYTSMNDDPIRISDPMGDEGENATSCCGFGKIWDGVVNTLNKVGDALAPVNRYVLDPINEYLNPLTPFVETATVKSYESRFTEAKPRLQSATEIAMVIIPGGKIEGAAVKAVENTVVKVETKAVEKYEVRAFEDLSKKVCKRRWA